MYMANILSVKVSRFFNADGIVTFQPLLLEQPDLHMSPWPSPQNKHKDELEMEKILNIKVKTVKCLKTNFFFFASLKRLTFP